VTAVLSWQAGGGIGSGHLSAVGASPWRAALAVGAELGIAGAAWLGAAAALQAWRRRGVAVAVAAVRAAKRPEVTADEPTTPLPKLVAVSDADPDADDATESGQLAG
jgi:hypothetical protein